MIVFLALIDDEEDKQIFIHLYETYKQSMFLCAKQVLENDDDAEDAIQDAFLNIALNIKKYDFHKDPRNLMLTIAKNSAISIQRKQKREHVAEDIDDLADKTAYKDNKNEYDIKEDADRIYGIIKSMPEMYSIIFILKFYHGLTYSQIEKVTGVDVNTAKKRIQRVKERIKKELSQEE